LAVTQLKCRDLFSRRTALLEADQLIVLDHGPISDRVRRIRFDRVGQVALAKRMPWPSLLALWLLVLLPAALLLVIANTRPLGSQPATLLLTVGVVLAVVAVAASVWYLICRQSRIYLQRAGQWYELRAIAPPGRVQSFVDGLVARIEGVQQCAGPGPASPATEAQPGPTPSA